MFLTLFTISLIVCFIYGLQRILKETFPMNTDHTKYTQLDNDFDRFELEAFSSELSNRAINTLDKLGIKTWKDLKQITINKILEVKGTGMSTASEISKFAKKYFKITIKN